MLRRLPVPALVLAAALALGGCHGSPRPAAVGTPRTSVAYSAIVASRMHVVRVRFCDLVQAREVRRATGGSRAAAISWGNGAPIPVVAGADVGHELGCSWTGPTGVVARAWVFARPVTGAFAASIVAAAAHQRSCTGRPNTIFGKPAMTQVCSGPSRSVRIRQAGLFGDTWLSCEIQASRQSVPVLLRRTDDWCAAVASALDTAG
ncbi:MAG: hypothetical protein JWQ32_2700 [Marmoricola sp.]|nr:hypothetical protein [Marmoricola sp.]